MSQRAVNKIVISASHNVVQLQETADERILRKAQSDRDAGRECVSYNFMRVALPPIDTNIPHVDENKCLMPIYHRVPLLAHKVIQRVSQDLEVVVVGSHEVALVVESLRDFLGVDEYKLRHVQEKRSLAENISAGSNDLPLCKGEGFVFEAGDTPFADNLDDILNDTDIEKHILVGDLNGLTTAFDGDPFFARNYYWDVHNGDTYVPCKEPNAWLFRADFPFDEVNTFYQNRQGGKLDMFKVFSIIGPKFMIRAPFLSLTACYDIARGTGRAIVKAIAGSSKPWKFHASTLEEVSPMFFNGESAKFKVTHNDPFRIKDVDAWHDLWFYKHLVNHTESHPDGRSVLPYFSQVDAYSDFIEKQGLPDEIGVLRNFPRYANHRALTLRMPISPFSSNKEFQAPLEPGTDLDVALYHLEQRQ